ncbi:protein kinase [Archangium violaceum]|uniref:protein kinase domain-containing protein n=1 Tax=Archangium violaceum TaxID=83451 RepID=UPI00194FDD45|nr:protein kinase [Archangium violaceum]QRN95417.1 protein kinase [Archangium violaceum]
MREHIEPQHERARQPGSEDVLEEVDSELDFGDSFLAQVAHSVPQVMRKPRPGERMGGRDGRRFEILEELGGGAMGLVFRARDAELQRVVALKFLLPREEGPGENRMVALLKQEARAVAQLDHENIVRIFDVSEWEGGSWERPVPFLVMECLEGEPLSTQLQRGLPGLKRSVEILESVAAGLAHAHQRHIIHRDLKPSNVFITQRGTVKLLDFGLAYLMSSSSPDVPNLPTAGTPPYMAPEQWRGEALDERTDIWAAGILMYELLTRELPYPSASLEELREHVTSAAQVPTLRLRHPELPEEVERLVASALAKEPARRLASAQELREELRELAERLGLRQEAPRAVEFQRRTVTLVSCRLTGFEGSLEQLDPEDFSELEATFHRSCAELIQRHGGSIALSMGDEVLACFGYPLAHEEDSEHAVRAAMELVRHFAEGHEPLPSPDARLAVKVGIHTDVVALDERAGGHRGQALAIQGEAPRIASWLSRQAEPGAVVLSGTTCKLVRGLCELEALGGHAFEGLAGTLNVDVCRLVRERKVVSRFDRSRVSGTLTPLVGRERELGQLLDHWERARQGHGGSVLLVGEAGIGKSRLVQEVRERVETEPSLCLRCQCWSQSSTSAFHPVIEMLQHLCQEDGSARDLQEQLRGLAQRSGVSPEHMRVMVSFLSLPLQGGEPASSQLSPERRKELVLESLVALLLRAAQDRPVLVVVEDLHWADPSTLQLLGSMMERIARARVMVLLSARPEFQPPWPPPGFKRLVLERLSADCTAKLVRESAHGTRLTEETVHQLVAKTDGIPLFVEEMTHMVLERAPGSGELPSSIPMSLHELLLARLDMLPSRQKALAQLCAVAGRDFTFPLLAALTRHEEGGLRRDLEGLMATGLLQRQEEEEEDSVPGYQFRHALIQEAAYQSLLRKTRRHHHQRIAQVLVEQFPEQVETRPELLAHHYTEAGQYALAIQHWSRAGTRASQRSANLEAISHLKNALRLLHHLPDAVQRKEQELQLRMAMGYSLIQVHGFSSPDLEQTFGRIRQLIPEVGDALPRLELSSWAPFSYYTARAELTLAQEFAERILNAGERHHDRQLLALGYRMQATNLFTWGRMREARTSIERALECSDFTLEEHRAMALKHLTNPRVAVLTYGSVVLSTLDQPEEARRYMMEGLELSARIGHPNTTAFALTYCALGCQLRRDAPGVLRLTDESIALSREHLFRVWLGMSTLFRCWALSELGQPREALALMSKGLEHWNVSGFRIGMPHNLAMLTEIHLKLGQVREAWTIINEALAVPDQTGERSYEPQLYRLRGEILRMLGQEEAAREDFLRGLRIAREQGTRTYERHVMESLARQAAYVGEPEHPS